MRVFVTVGNSLDPFDRLLRMVDEALPSEGWEGLCQHGVSAVRPRALSPVQVLSRREFDAALEEADVVICHAGVGTLWSALEAGHRPLVIPRRAGLGELVNDHQLEICDALEFDGLIRVISTVNELAEGLKQSTRVPRRPGREAAGLEAVGAAFRALGARRHRPRPWLLRVLEVAAPPLERLRVR